MRANKIAIVLLLFTTLISNACSNTSEIENTGGLPKRYSLEIAQENRDVIGTAVKVINVNKLDDFINNANKGKKDSVRITRYTIEGEAIIQVLIYDGKEINYILDTTRDSFGEQKITRGKVEQILKEKKEEISNNKEVNYTSYYLIENNNKSLTLDIEMILKKNSWTYKLPITQDGCITSWGEPFRRFATPLRLSEAVIGLLVLKSI